MSNSCVTLLEASKCQAHATHLHPASDEYCTGSNDHNIFREDILVIMKTTTGIVLMVKDRNQLIY